MDIHEKRDLKTPAFFAYHTTILIRPNLKCSHFVDWQRIDRRLILKVIFATPILKFLLTFLVVFVSLFHIFKTIYHKTDHPVLPLAMFFIVIFSDTDVRILLLDFRAFIFLLCSLVLFLTILLLDNQTWEDPFLLSHPFPPHLNLIPYLGGFGNKCALLTLGDMLSWATLYQKKAVPTIFRNGQDRCLQSKSAKENSNT